MAETVHRRDPPRALGGDGARPGRLPDGPGHRPVRRRLPRDEGLHERFGRLRVVNTAVRVGRRDRRRPGPPSRASARWSRCSSPTSCRAASTRSSTTSPRPGTAGRPRCPWWCGSLRRRRRRGAFHSQSPEAWFAHTPGLVVVAPATPRDALGLLRHPSATPTPSSTSSTARSTAARRTISPATGVTRSAAPRRARGDRHRPRGAGPSRVARRRREAGGGGRLRRGRRPPHACPARRGDRVRQRAEDRQGDRRPRGHGHRGLSAPSSSPASPTSASSTSTARSAAWRTRPPSPHSKSSSGNHRRRARRSSTPPAGWLGTDRYWVETAPDTITDALTLTCTCGTATRRLATVEAAQPMALNAERHHGAGHAVGRRARITVPDARNVSSCFATTSITP